jgi:hypothetical protein
MFNINVRQYFFSFKHYEMDLKKKLYGLRVHERTIPTERSPLVGEVIANFCG